LTLLIETFYQPFSFWMQSLYVVSGAMYPTLEVGDCFVLTKYRHDKSSKKIRGHVIAFEFTEARFKESDVYTSRCIGLPGDRVQMRQGILYINGEPVKLERIGDYLMVDPRMAGEMKVIPQYRETLPNGVSYNILKEYPFGEWALDNTPEFVVPPDRFFMMGDNRDHSSDSRAMNPVGFVPFEKLIGPAQLLWFSTEAKWYEPQRWLSGLRFSRLFKWIR
jgi:signal peptidase I